MPDHRFFDIFKDKGILFLATPRLLLVMVLLAVAMPLRAQDDLQFESRARLSRAKTNDQIEPNAGKWQTWVISSGKDYRVPPPPSRRETRAELRTLAELVSQNDEKDFQQIAFWDAGAPAYRWIDLINTRQLGGIPTSVYIHRAYAYVALAMYDATIATWESKYFYNRPRPSELDHRLPTAARVPNSPSYPSEHAAAAQAAATVLAYLLPAEAETFQKSERWFSVGSGKAWAS
jgi:PAP2 superfamily